MIHGCSFRKIKFGPATVSFGTGGTSHGGGAERILQTQGGISQDCCLGNIRKLGWVQTGCSGQEARLGRDAASFGTGGTSHGGGAERMLLTQGGISQGRWSRNRWELRWLRTEGVSEGFGMEVFALRFRGGRSSSSVSSRKEIISDVGVLGASLIVLVSEGRCWCKEDSDTW